MLGHLLFLSATLLSLSTALPTTPTDSLSLFTRDGPPISKRSLSGLTIKMFMGKNCDGVSAGLGNVPYDTSVLASSDDYKSIQWLGRALLNTEQINTYRTASDDGDPCGIYTGGFSRNTRAGCYPINGFRCFRLIHP